jgi:flagellar biosynthesis protein
MKPSADANSAGSKFAGRGDGKPAKDTIAVALQSTPGNPQAIPRVVATGRGEFAEVILDIAFRNGVKVRKDTNLAEILAAVDLDSEIPVEAFIAVAEILRYVYAADTPEGMNATTPETPGSRK